MREEMEFHRAARTSDLIDRGMDPNEAARTARLEFGNAEAYREECRKELGYRPWDELSADLRFAARGMTKNPGFAAATITILALAIGVNGAFFSLYSNYVLKPLAIRGVERHFSVLDSIGMAGPHLPGALWRSKPCAGVLGRRWRASMFRTHSRCWLSHRYSDRP
jgi:hypothetical protein